MMNVANPFCVHLDRHFLLDREWDKANNPVHIEQAQNETYTYQREFAFSSAFPNIDFSSIQTG